MSGLLAGIVLVDWLSVLPAGGGDALNAAGFAGLFLLALIFQRFVPAT